MVLGNECVVCELSYSTRDQEKWHICDGCNGLVHDSCSTGEYTMPVEWADHRIPVVFCKACAMVSDD